jgi:hypothetical protein
MKKHQMKDGPSIPYGILSSSRSATYHSNLATFQGRLSRGVVEVLRLAGLHAVDGYL